MVIVFMRKRNFEKKMVYLMRKLCWLVIDDDGIKRSGGIFYLGVWVGLNLRGE